MVVKRIRPTVLTTLRCKQVGQLFFLMLHCTSPSRHPYLAIEISKRESGLIRGFMGLLRIISKLVDYVGLVLEQWQANKQTILFPATFFLQSTS